MTPRQLLHRACREDFKTFVQAAFAVLNPGTAFMDNWHLDLVVEALRATRTGETRNLLINLPPRGLKSHIVSVCWPAYC